MEARENTGSDDGKVVIRVSKKVYDDLKALERKYKGKPRMTQREHDEGFRLLKKLLSEIESGAKLISEDGEDEKESC